MKIGTNVENLQFDVFHNKEIYKTNLNEFNSSWLILFFYPGDFTFVCPTELKALSNIYEKLKNNSCELLAISRDSAFVHKAWLDSDHILNDISYPLASDVNGEMSKLFNVLDENGEICRATYIINKNIIKSIEVIDSSVGRNINETLRKLEALKFTSDNKNHVCPVDWSSSKDSMELPGYVKK